MRADLACARQNIFSGAPKERCSTGRQRMFDASYGGTVVRTQSTALPPAVRVDVLSRAVCGEDSERATMAARALLCLLLALTCAAASAAAVAQEASSTGSLVRVVALSVERALLSASRSRQAQAEAPGPAKVSAWSVFFFTTAVAFATGCAPRARGDGLPSFQSTFARTVLPGPCARANVPRCPTLMHLCRAQLGRPAVLLLWPAEQHVGGHSELAGLWRDAGRLLRPHSRGAPRIASA